MKKRYKPKKWFTYTRLGLIFVVIFALSKTTNVVYSSITAENNNEAKALVQTQLAYEIKKFKSG